MSNVTNNKDVGIKLVETLRQSLQVDKRWSVATPRGFRWWGCGLAQSVWAEPVRMDGESSVSLVHIETDFMRCLQDDDNTQQAVNDLRDELASLFCFVYDPGMSTLKFHGTAYVHKDNFNWISKLCMASAALQLSEAHERSGSKKILKTFAGGELDFSAHPTSGERKMPDEMVHVVHSLFIPKGIPPLHVGAEFNTTKTFISSLGLCSDSDDGRISIEFLFPKGILKENHIAIFAAENHFHPLLGHGIYSNLTLPISCDKEDAVYCSNKFNFLESTQWTRCHLLGSWKFSLYEQGKYELKFSTFVPAVCYNPGLLKNLVLSNAIRSKWASQTI